MKPVTPCCVRLAELEKKQRAVAETLKWQEKMAAEIDVLFHRLDLTPTRRQYWRDRMKVWIDDAVAAELEKACERVVRVIVLTMQIGQANREKILTAIRASGKES